jgi:hypothetical protein
MDHKNGIGVEVLPDGAVYRGQFRQGQRQGTGALTSPNHARFAGDFEADLKHGKGLEEWPDGHYYHGMYVQGRAHGKGYMGHSQLGDSYEGQFANGKRHGEGTYTWFDTTRFQGQWADGLQHGKGVTCDIYNHVSEETWEHGKLVERISERTLFLPMAIDSDLLKEDAAGEYRILENCSYRNSKKLADLTHVVANAGQMMWGQDAGDGWVQFEVPVRSQSREVRSHTAKPLMPNLPS